MESLNLSLADFLVETADGSPTLRLDGGESMHSFDGAFTETCYIYGEALSLAFEGGLKPHVMSVGLGMGYCELIAYVLSRQRNLSVSIESYESRADLRNAFRALYESDLPRNPKNLEAGYQKMLGFFEEHYGIPKTELVEGLKQLDLEERLRFKGALSPQSFPWEPVSVILFDAFSSKITPELWDEAFLDRFLTAAAAPSCVLATYASKGTLKRSLKRAGFRLLEKPGFSRKRESTLAVRGNWDAEKLHHGYSKPQLRDMSAPVS